MGREVQTGATVLQAPRHGNKAPGAVGEIQGVTPEGALQVKVHKGQFTASENGPVTINGHEVGGAPSR
eukprot:2247933-Amphidinium_carterae.1